MSIARNIETIQHNIQQAVLKYHRPAGSVQLMAVSKNQSAAAIQEAYEAGINNFGENYWQEAQSKISTLKNLPLIWHFIGPIQSNKSAEIAKNFSWVHSVEREKVARLLAEHRPLTLPPLNVCIQINLDQEESKAGIQPDELAALATVINEFPSLKLRGLMAIPKPRATEGEQYQGFLQLAMLMAKINRQLELNMDTLSMGMSDDLTAAIHAGSTVVRVGRAIFGERIKS